MAWCPFATKVPVALRTSQKKSINPAGLVLHTAVSNSQNLKPSGEVRWHFYCNEEGELFQYFDTEIPASCQKDGNYWTEGGEGWGFISVETWDGAGRVWDGQDVRDCPPWTAKQVESLARLYAWLHETHECPLGVATGVHGRGLGVHNDFTAKSGPRWNTSHACPTTKRKAQRPAILSRAKAIVEQNKPVPPPIEEDDVNPSDLEKIAQRTAELVAKKRISDANPATVDPQLGEWLAGSGLKLDRLAQAIKALSENAPASVQRAVANALEGKK